MEKFIVKTKIALKCSKVIFSTRISDFNSLKYCEKIGVEKNPKIKNMTFLSIFFKLLYNLPKKWISDFFSLILIKIVLNPLESRLTKIQRFLPSVIFVKIS